MHRPECVLYKPMSLYLCPHPKDLTSCVIGVGFSLREYASFQLVFQTCHYHFSISNDTVDFPDSSVGKESACNAGDPGSIPGLGKSAGEGIGYPFQYFWASLMVQLVKNPSAMWETWV